MLLQAGLSERIFRRATLQIGVGQPKEVDQRRVIVVDDDEITRAALQFMLHEEIETHRACNAGRGLCHGRRLAKTASGVARRLFLSKRGGADRRTGAPFPDDRILIISDRSDQIRAFVEHHNHVRFHESIDNLTPADGYFGRAEADPRQAKTCQAQQHHKAPFAASIASNSNP
ncbi:hypothetical protein [Bradyrhizobium lablabi]|uniref:hypothetical protein n=1 Tax=Bradyrhizobium lablabi TaxID=722472 RepID=UPI0018F8B9B4